MEDTYFTRKAEETYGQQVVGWVRDGFDNESVTEAFFAVSAQIDMLVEENEVNVWDADFRDLDDDSWTLDRILDAADETATLAQKQKSGVWPMIASLAACMRAMVRTAPLCPSETFQAQKDSKVPPGMVDLLTREDLRPLDILVAAVAEDLGPGTATATAVAAERETCLSLIQNQIDKTIGHADTREALEAEHERLESRLEDLCREDTGLEEAGSIAAIDEVETEIRGVEFRLAACDLLEEVKTGIEARRPQVEEWVESEPAAQPAAVASPIAPKVDPTIKDRVIDSICEHLGASHEAVTLTTNFAKDLGADSLDALEILMDLEEEFNIDISDDEADKIQTVGEAIKYVEERVSASART